ncbi:LapA family protein [Elongatibacter sediminis]|uniref:LapA family protein n=1 Tax=Elongatibacter sediminis TaxID=3119006 RepID=UPI00339D4AD1
MYRLGFIIVTILAVVLGLLVGTLNNEPVAIDLLWFHLVWPLGLALIGALAVGMVLGLALSWLFSVLPLKVRLRKARRAGEANQSLLNRPHD